ncbi:hypothetical protein HOE425_340283 [Hoeflea sp. EC-HK425]|nr:hypothetical protein HOE425_340283 [Hoeflea sp. EC-HK425]
MAGAGARRSAGNRGAQPARHVGKVRAYAIWRRTAVFARTACHHSARKQFHARGLRRGAVLSALAAGRDSAHAAGFRAPWPETVAGVLRSDHRRGTETALPGAARGGARLAPCVRSGTFSANLAYLAPTGQAAQVSGLSDTLDKTAARGYFRRLGLGFQLARKLLYEQHRHAPPETGCYGYRGLCAGARDRAWRRQGLQAVFQ